MSNEPIATELRDIIAMALQAAESDALQDGKVPGYSMWADAALAAMQTAGWQQVAVPAGVAYGDLFLEWRGCGGDQRAVVWTAPGGTVMVQNIEPGDLKPADARLLAAALLGAANAAEWEAK